MIFLLMIIDFCTEVINRYAPYILLVLILVMLATIVMPYIIDPTYFKTNTNPQLH
ncbi:MAG: hypothetical protein ACXVAY_04740 [Mucilaginibacter sp.]